MTEIPDAVVEAATEAICDHPLGRVRQNMAPCLYCHNLAVAALAAASVSWAEQPRDRDNRGRWIFGKEAACRFIAGTAWPWEAPENRDSWAPRIGDEPEFGAKELAAAYRRLDEAAESVGLTPSWAEQLDTANARRGTRLFCNDQDCEDPSHETVFTGSPTLTNSKDSGLESDLTAALARNAECEEQRDAEQEMHAEDCAENSRLRAELDSLREKLASEIVSDGPKHPYNADEQVRINAWCDGLHFAAAIVRGTNDD